MDDYINLTLENIDKEHICCAISDKKHQFGVQAKKAWLKNQIKQGHIFRKLNASGKVFIEYGDLEKEYVPIIGDNYTYIYCFWVSGSFKEQGHGKKLLEYAINDAKSKGKNGICILVGNKKMPFLSDKKFLEKYNFKTVDKIAPYFELMALSFNDKIPSPLFTESARENKVSEQGLVIYYSDECPYINNCILEITDTCTEENIPLTLHKIDSVEKAKNLPCLFNNFCVFFNGRFLTHELLNKSRLLKFLSNVSAL